MHGWQNAHALLQETYKLCMQALLKCRSGVAQPRADVFLAPGVSGAIGVVRLFGQGLTLICPSTWPPLEAHIEVKPWPSKSSAAGCSNSVHSQPDILA